MAAMRSASSCLLVLGLALSGCGDGASGAAGLEPWQDAATPADLKKILDDAGGKPVIAKIWADW